MGADNFLNATSDKTKRVFFSFLGLLFFLLPLCAIAVEPLLLGVPQNITFEPSKSNMRVKPASTESTKGTIASSASSNNLHVSQSPQVLLMAKSDEPTDPAWASVQAARDANKINESAVKWNRISAIFLALTLLATGWAAWAASRSALVAQSVLEGTNRPYLVIEYLDANFAHDTAPQNNLTVRFRIKNVGGAPAIIDTYRSTLGFEDPRLPKDWQDSLGGSNIFVIEKDGYSPVLQAQANVSDIAFKQNLVREGKQLTWRVNFSYTDLSGQRRNFYFTNYYGAPPYFSYFRSNFPPRVVVVPFDRRKTFLRQQFWQAQRQRIKRLFRKAPSLPNAKI